MDAEKAIHLIAMKEGETKETIREHMKIAILEAINSNDPDIQARWKKIPCKGKMPTPEELITYIAECVKAGVEPFA